MSCKSLRPVFHGDLLIGDDIVIPVGMSRRASFGGHDDEAIAIFKGYQGINTFLSTLGAGGVEKNEGVVRKPLTGSVMP